MSDKTSPKVHSAGAPPREGRAAQALREVSVTIGVNRHAEGSALVRWGDTQVIATLSVESKLPPHLRGRAAKGGWLNAEYAMLPRATHERLPRERSILRGRTQEIQRMLGRALRATVDLSMFPGKTMQVDCDVLQADGGTRCAALLAAYAALHQYADAQVFAGKLSEWPLRHELAAVSVGMVAGEIRLDLDYREDAAAEVDLAVVGTADGQVVEVHGGGEGAPLPAETYVAMVAFGLSGVADLLRQVRGGWAR